MRVHMYCALCLISLIDIIISQSEASLFYSSCPHFTFTFVFTFVQAQQGQRHAEKTAIDELNATYYYSCTRASMLYSDRHG